MADLDIFSALDDFEAQIAKVSAETASADEPTKKKKRGVSFGQNSVKVVDQSQKIVKRKAAVIAKGPQKRARFADANDSNSNSASSRPPPGFKQPSGSVPNLKSVLKNSGQSSSNMPPTTTALQADIARMKQQQQQQHQQQQIQQSQSRLAPMPSSAPFNPYAPNIPQHMGHNQMPADVMAMMGHQGSQISGNDEYSKQLRKQKRKQDMKKLSKSSFRMQGTEAWIDPTLSDWPENDYRLFIGDIGNEVTDDMINKAFRHYPSFAKSRVVRDKRTGKSKGYGFVSFLTPACFVRAFKEMQAKHIGNRPIRLLKSNYMAKAQNKKKHQKARRKNKKHVI